MIFRDCERVAAGQPTFAADGGFVVPSTSAEAPTLGPPSNLDQQSKRRGGCE